MISNFDNDGSAQANEQASSSDLGFAALDNLKRDRFELLSAYMDGEVTALEKRQVEQWLVEDQNFRCLYGRLRQLRHGLKTMPVPTTSQVSIDETIEAVCKKVDRRPQVLLALVGTAITVLAASLVPPVRVQFANFLKEIPQPPAESLKIDLNTPVLGPESGIAPAALPQSTHVDGENNLELGVHQLVLPVDAATVAMPDGDRSSTAE
ncbi:MAG: anti-sigma factor [Leptolyngbyaceae cyanobacterium]